MSCFFRFLIFGVLFLATSSQAQVIDVDGDGKVGPQEAIAVSKQWHQSASKSDNNHDHLGQTWSLNNNQLIIYGSSPNVALWLNNSNGMGMQAVSEGAGSYSAYFRSMEGPGILVHAADDSRPDIELGGSVGANDNGVLSSDWDDSDSDLVLISNDTLELRLDNDNNNNSSFFRIRNGGMISICELNESGDMNIKGQYLSTLKTTHVDHPLDPSGKFLNHFSVDSPEVLNIYSGNVVLDDKGEAVVELPEYFEAYNSDYRYHLTCVGGYAPVYVAEEIQDGHFRIGGGKSGLKVSWEVTGVRKDPSIKADSTCVEEAKQGDEKGRFLAPEAYSQPQEKSLWVDNLP